MKISQRLICILLTMVLLCSTICMSASAQDALVYGIGFVNASSLRLRQEANTTSKTIATAWNKECVIVLSQEGEWYRVLYNLQEGYMHQDYLDVLTTENAELGNAKVTGTAVNLRKGPGTQHEKTGTASKGDTCSIIGINQGWYKVIYQGTICYIRSDYLELTEVPYENRASQESPKYFRLGKSIGALPASAAAEAVSTVPANVTGADIVAKARQYLGTPYVYGGASPSGFDCSGFTYYVLKALGYTPARTPAAQISLGTAVEKSELQPGDIVFFAGTGASGISHVGIYTGNGQFIHAPNSRSVVSYADLTSGYWADHYYSARRVV